ncbi:MAG: SRPBCC family protein [Longimicrobiales bacterium]
MSDVKRVQFHTTIRAPAALVWEVMLGPETYPRWTRAFVEGSYFEGDWSQGSRIRFLAPGGDGMVAEIAENRPHEFVSIRHLGFIVNGIEDTESDSVLAWAPAYENYTLTSVEEGTKIVIDQDVTEEVEQCMIDTWPKASELLRQLCEEGGGV